jgi:trans-aconitate 2-methyltransferase
MAREHYTFGDNDRAAERLALLARVYEPTTRRWLGAWRWSAPERAVDLGCGPGYTTELLREAVGARQTWGLDASDAHVRRARDRLDSSELRFAVHDVTATPFPVYAVDVVYARHLLAHLAAPAAALMTWATVTRPGGRLVLEETAALESPDPVFVDYYAHVRALQRHYGQDTFVGRRLGAIADRTAWRVERFEVTRVVLDARLMATLHALNLRTWSRDPFAASTFDPRTIAAMGEALEAVAGGARDAPPVSGDVGQAVLVR